MKKFLFGTLFVTLFIFASVAFAKVCNLYDVECQEGVLPT